MITDDLEIKSIWGVKENVRELIKHGTPLEFYLGSEPRYLARVKSNDGDIRIYKFTYQEFVSTYMDKCMDNILKTPSDEFIWDFENNQLVYDFKTKEKSNRFSVFPRFPDNIHFTTTLAIAPDSFIFLASNASNLNSALFCVYYMNYLNCSLTLKYEGLENTISLIESVYGLPKSDLFSYGYTEIKNLMPEIKMKGEKRIPAKLLESITNEILVEKNKTYTLSEIIKTKEIPTTNTPIDIVIDEKIYALESAYILEGILYIKVPLQLGDEDLDLILESLDINDENVIFYTGELLKETDNDEDTNWRY